MNIIKVIHTQNVQHTHSHTHKHRDIDQLRPQKVFSLLSTWFRWYLCNVICEIALSVYARQAALDLLKTWIQRYQWRWSDIPINDLMLSVVWGLCGWSTLSIKPGMSRGLISGQGPRVWLLIEPMQRPREDLHRHRENMQSPHNIPDPRSHSATAPPCHHSIRGTLWQNYTFTTKLISPLRWDWFFMYVTHEILDVSVHITEETNYIL